MKYLRFSGLCLLFLCFYTLSFGQQHRAPLQEPDLNRPKLFAQLPDRIAIDSLELNQLFNLASRSESGNELNLKLRGRGVSSLRTQMVKTVSRSENRIQTAQLRLKEFNGAMLTVSKVLHEDGTSHYTGRIISPGNGDAFELKQENGQYYLVKKNFYEIINE